MDISSPRAAHSRGLLAALVTVVVLCAVSLAGDETLLQEYLGVEPPDPRDALPWISYEEALERMEKWSSGGGKGGSGGGGGGGGGGGSARDGRGGGKR